MRPDRRRALIAGFAAGLMQAPLAGVLQAASDAVERTALDAFLDTLLPADAVSPAASALGIGDEILDLAAGSDLFVRLLALGSEFLNAAGPVPFAELPPDARHRVAAWMEASDYDQIPGRYFHLVRQSAVEFYYARPEAAAGFGLNVAPQPAGYPPPWG